MESILPQPWFEYWAAATCFLYVVISLVVGDRFPFSRYSMYASTAGRSHGAVLYCKADGEFVDVHRLDGFAGIDPAAIYPEGLACSLEWKVHEARRFIEQHQAAPGAEPGAVRVELGYRLLQVDERGVLTQRFRPVAHGTADTLR